MKRNKHDNISLCKNVNINKEYENEESIYHSNLSDMIITFNFTSQISKLDKYQYLTLQHRKMLIVQQAVTKL